MFNDHENDTYSDQVMASQHDNYRTNADIRAAKAYSAGYAQAVADMQAKRIAEAEAMVRRCQRTPEREMSAQQAVEIAKAKALNFALDKIAEVAA